MKNIEKKFALLDKIKRKQKLINNINEITCVEFMSILGLFIFMAPFLRHELFIKFLISISIPVFITLVSKSITCLININCNSIKNKVNKLNKIIDDESDDNVLVNEKETSKNTSLVKEDDIVNKLNELINLRESLLNQDEINKESKTIK